MPRNPKQDANLAPPFTSDQSREEAAKNGHKGGVKSGEVRRLRRDAKKAIRYLMELDAEGNTNLNLEIVGVPEEHRSNMMATWAKCYTDWLKTGDIRLLEILMKYGGFDEAELRKKKESEARIRAMDKSGIPVSGEVDAPSQSQVMIILPDDGRGAPGAVGITESDTKSLMQEQQN